jgi:hypothetical protein
MKGAVWGLRSGSPAIMVKHTGTSVRVLADMGIGSAARHEVRVPTVLIPLFQPMRLRLVYGVWEERGGSRVLFSRDYCPLWRISATGDVSRADPWHWIYFVEQTFWWDDADTPWGRPATARRIEEQMRGCGVTGTPRLMDAVDILITGKAETIYGAVRYMMPPGEVPHHQLQMAH